jgi:hypothetical protein
MPTAIRDARMHAALSVVEQIIVNTRGRRACRRVSFVKIRARVTLSLAGLLIVVSAVAYRAQSRVEAGAEGQRQMPLLMRMATCGCNSG